MKNNLEVNSSGLMYEWNDLNNKPFTNIDTEQFSVQGSGRTLTINNVNFSDTFSNDTRESVIGYTIYTRMLEQDRQINAGTNIINYLNESGNLLGEVWIDMQNSYSTSPQNEHYPLAWYNSPSEYIRAYAVTDSGQSARVNIEVGEDLSEWRIRLIIRYTETL